MIEEVFRHEPDNLCTSAYDGDLHALLIGLVRYSTRSKGLAAALEAVMATASPVFDEARRRMEETLDDLLARSVAAGTVRADVAGHTVLRALGRVCSPRAGEVELLQIAELFFGGPRYGAPTTGGVHGDAVEAATGAP